MSDVLVSEASMEALAAALNSFDPQFRAMLADMLTAKNDAVAATTAANDAATTVSQAVKVPANTVLEVGPGKEFTTVYAAWRSLRGKIIEDMVTIQLSDGVHQISGSIPLEGFRASDESHIRIIGNLSDPSACIIEPAPPSGSTASYGFILSDVFGLELGGFTIRGNPQSIGEMRYGILSYGCDFRIVPNSLIIENANVGVSLRYGSRFRGTGLKITNCNHGAQIESASFASMPNIEVKNDADDYQTIVKVGFNVNIRSTLIATGMKVEGFHICVQAQYGSYVYGYAATLDRFMSGWYAVNGSSIFAGSCTFGPDAGATQYNPATHAAIGNNQSYILQ